MEWLQQINDISLNGDHPRVVDLQNVMCRMKHNNNSVIPIENVKSDEFLCSYKTHCFPKCLCCEFYACDCRMQCPEGCNCLHDSAWGINSIQCSNRNHQDVPLLIPMDATEIRLDGNNMSDVDTQSFIGRRRVTTLYLNNSRITSISKQTLSGLAALEVLHLEDNLLKDIVGHEFSSLVSLRELYLHNNDLIHIHANAFAALTSLSVLTLDGNLLTTFPMWTLVKTNPFLTTISISKNLWSCDCDFLIPFKRFLQTHERRVLDIGELACMTDNLVEKVIDLTTQNVTSCIANSEDVTSETIVDNLIPIVVTSTLAIVIVIVLFLVACLFRSKIKNWLYNKSSEIYESRSGSSVHSGGSCYSQNKLFDVYISYSIKDSEFVDHNLAPTLEQGSTAYKLCLHQRDFPPSASLYDTVSVATESSSRVILVLSRAYLECEWPHVKIPLRNSLQGNRELNTNKVILILLEDIAEESLNDLPELKQYMKTCAAVRWGTPGFLNKLRFFLPEPAFLTFQRNVTLRTLQPTLLKSSSLLQVDQVSGIWTYTLQPSQMMQQQQSKNSSSSPVGSVSTQSTNDDVVLMSPRYSFTNNNNPPSVISSLYSHHTYQSIPESHHIYHTLEPNLAAGKQLDHEEDNPINSVYINRNLDLVMKSGSSSAEIEPKVELRRSQSAGGMGKRKPNGNRKKKKSEKLASSSFSSSSSSSSSLPNVKEEVISCDDENKHHQDIKGNNQGQEEEKEKESFSFHHSNHKSQSSTLSAQQLLPSSSVSSSNEDEYIV